MINALRRLFRISPAPVAQHAELIRLSKQEGFASGLNHAYGSVAVELALSSYWLGQRGHKKEAMALWEAAHLFTPCNKKYIPDFSKPESPFSLSRMIEHRYLGRPFPNDEDRRQEFNEFIKAMVVWHRAKIQEKSPPCGGRAVMV